jgi:predicted RNA-binding protein YlqC (UPF0109 family)
MKNLLEFLLIHLVDYPDQVGVEHREEGDTDIYVLTVAPEDMGRVIGKNGKIINAIRTHARVRAVKENRHISIVLADVQEAAPVAE